MPTNPQAFLSYTRLDDDFFGGAITSLRKTLELGVQVVTGNKNFCIFQDVDGIELGQQWQQKLDEAVAGANFLIPILTPLFFQSGACRDELQKFISHEENLGRNDLILPIYYVTTPLLEKKDLLGADPIATQISGRQRQDWREQADLPVNDPQVKKSVRLLAEKIASAISRASATVRDDPIEENRRSIELRNTADLVAREQAPKDKSSRRLILWVDDRPDNNIMERNAFSAYNIDFVLALSTKEAMNKLSELHFDAMISDMGRPPDPQAGYTLLHKVRSSGNAIPFFIYAGSRAPQHREEARRRGAQGTTNMPAELIQMVLEGIALRDGEANDDRPR